jgi:hypothetical protein
VGRVRRQRIEHWWQILRGVWGANAYSNTDCDPNSDFNSYANSDPNSNAYADAMHGQMYTDDLISDALPFGRLWYADANAIANAIGYAEHYSRSHDAVIRVYDDAGNVIETHEHKGDFREW